MLDDIDFWGWYLLVLGVMMVIASVFLPILNIAKAVMNFQPGFGGLQIGIAIAGVFAIIGGWQLTR